MLQSADARFCLVDWVIFVYFWWKITRVFIAATNNHFSFLLPILLSVSLGRPQQGGGIYISGSSSSVNIYITTFSGNSASSGNDIYRFSGTVMIHSVCPAGYDASNIVQGGSISTSGTISGSKYSYSGGCSVCPEGKLYLNSNVSQNQSRDLYFY